jgi:hypothetical protein
MVHGVTEGVLVHRRGGGQVYKMNFELFLFFLFSLNDLFTLAITYL